MTRLPSYEYPLQTSSDAGPRRSVGAAFLQYLILLRILLAEYRTMWLFYIFFSFIWPLGTILFVSLVLGVGNKDQAIFLLGGNMANSVAFGPAFILMNKMGLGRETHEFEYWARLPLPKIVFVLAFISVGLLLTLPGLVGVFIIGIWLLNLQFSVGLLLLPLLPLGAIPLAALGMALGNFIANGPTANAIANILVISIGFLSPMYLPLQTLPEPLRTIAWFLPTTYLADAFRAAFGAKGTHLPLDMLILVTCSIVFLCVVQWRLDWRAEA